MDEVANLTVPAPVLKVAVWDGYVAWATGPELGTYDAISLWEEATGAVRTVAKAAQPDGQIQWVRGSGKDLVYVEFDHGLSDAERTTPWRVIHLDLDTGESREVASSTPATECCAPFPVIDDHWIVWIGGGQEAIAPIVAYDIATGERRDVITTDAGIVWIDGSNIVYGAASQNGRDAFVIGVEPSAQPRMLTSTGRVGYLAARDGYVAWEEPEDDEQPGLTVWALAVDGETPTKLTDTGSNPRPGDGVVGWIEGGSAIRIASLATGDTIEVTPGPVSIFARLDIDGRRLAWAEDNPDGTVNVRIADIRP